MSGDSTSVRNLVLKILTPATGGQLSFVVRTNEVITGMTPTAPNVTPLWMTHDSSKTADGSLLKRLIMVHFQPGLTVAEKQAAIDTVQGTVVGGGPLGSPDQGLYYIKVPWATTPALLDSAEKVLNTKPAIKRTILVFFLTAPGRRAKRQSQWLPDMESY